jgi:hypothetical protein
MLQLQKQFKAREKTTYQIPNVSKETERREPRRHWVGAVLVQNLTLRYQHTVLPQHTKTGDTGTDKLGLDEVIVPRPTVLLLSRPRDGRLSLLWYCIGPGGVHKPLRLAEEIHRRQPNAWELVRESPVREAHILPRIGDAVVNDLFVVVFVVVKVQRVG